METAIGYTARTWLRLLSENRFGIDTPYWRPAFVVTLMSLGNSRGRRREESLYGREFNSAHVAPPLFILGHWRSGTTFLHNLITLDQQFAFPNLFQVTHPNTCMLREEMVRKALAGSEGEKRHMDNMKVTFDSPGEDEFALLVMSLKSPMLGWVFPRRERHYARYLTFRSVSKEELDAWKAAFLAFLKKLSWRYKRPLVLKSPTHTARINILLELFPDARFLHIHRNPFTVFRSTQKLLRETVPRTCLQRPPAGDDVEGILSRYNEMYDAFFEERSLIPSGRYYEICYEDLESNVEQELRKAYEGLQISGFDDFLPKLRAYIASLRGYRKNVHDTIEAPLRTRIADAWQRCFAEWGYPA